MSVEEAFAKVVGRQASDEERVRLYRLRDALCLRDNDALRIRATVAAIKRGGRVGQAT